MDRARQAHARLYDSLLADMPGITVPQVPAAGSMSITCTPFVFEWLAPDHISHTWAAKLRSDMVQRRLAEPGIASMVYYPVPLHLQPFYAAVGGKPAISASASVPLSEVLSIPIYPELTRARSTRIARGSSRASGLR